MLDFQHNFKDFIDRLYSEDTSIESNTDSYLRGWNYAFQRQTFLIKIRYTGSIILAQKETSVTKIIFFGKPDFKNLLNEDIIDATISFILSAKLFNFHLVSSWFITFYGTLWFSTSILLLFLLITIWFYYNCLFLTHAVPSLSWIQLYILDF